MDAKILSQNTGTILEQRESQTHLQKVLDSCLGALPALYRMPVLLVDVQGLGYNEAAAVLKISKETLKSRLARGRVKMQVACSQLAGYWLRTVERIE